MEYLDFLKNLENKRLILALGIFILAILVRYVFSVLILPVISKATKRTKTDFDDEIFKIIEPPVRLFITVIGIFAAFKVLITSPDFNSVMVKLFKSFVIFDLCWVFYRAEVIIEKMLKKIFQKQKLETALGFMPVFNKFIKISIIVLGFLVIIQEWGFNIGAVITGLGIGGVAVALAAKDTVANFFGSLMILFDTPFKIGDWIQTSSMEGVVEDIGFRSTKVRTFAQALVSIPNSILANDVITNWSRMGKRRIKYKLGIKYSTPVQKIREFLIAVREMLNEHPGIHKETIFIYFDEFGDSSLNIFCYFFTSTINWKKYLETREDVNLKIIEIAESLGIEFAFPSTSVYIENDSKLRI